ncbi:MAG: alkene reductase [Myxococcota bacterium]
MLFEPLDLGALTLPHRILMSPMTRSRAATPGDVPHALNATYYAQRASAGLIVSEATQVDPQGKGYAYTPGMYDDAQVAGWRLVTDAVHAAGGRMVAQLWHVGRMSHTDFHDGAAPVSSSALRPDDDWRGQVWRGDEEPFVPTSPPRALALDEIAGVVAMFRRAAQCARDAGFDGVELHGANGYLVQQFLSDRVNRRDDVYGGNVANRIRFPVEVLTALCEVWGSDRVGMRISPGLGVNGCDETDPPALYATLCDALNDLDLAYLDVVEFYGPPKHRPDAPSPVQQVIRERFAGAYLANGGYDLARAERALSRGDADAIVFGKPFISNPDLPARLRQGIPLARWNRDTFYGGDARGYTDYPVADRP